MEIPLLYDKKCIHVHLYFVRYELLFVRSLVRRHNPHFPKCVYM